MNESVPVFFTSLKSLLGRALLQSLSVTYVEEVFDTLLDFLSGRSVRNISMKILESAESL